MIKEKSLVDFEVDTKCNSFDNTCDLEWQFRTWECDCQYLLLMRMIHPAFYEAALELIG